MFCRRHLCEVRRKRKGALLAETIMAIGVLMAVAVPASVLVDSAIEAADRARHNIVAARAAEQLINQVASTQFIAQNGGLPQSDDGHHAAHPAYDWTRTIEHDTQSGGAIVRVEVTFSSQSQPAVSMSRVLAVFDELSRRNSDERQHGLLRRSDR
ncbi:MAG: hypothetical protein ABGZ35_31710 [Planctomycetaceae bacterium]|jgi:hypothetical protein